MSNRQLAMGIEDDRRIDNIEEYQFDQPPKPIRGYPELWWSGKRPFRSTRFYPAQLKEIHGSDVEGWRNKIFWGDNLQVMSHLLKEYRGKVDLIYIDPPFDSKADYKRTISVKGKQSSSDLGSFEEKQYTDLWTNDEYLQFMFERLVLLREMLSEQGSLFIHCDWHKSHYLRLLLDEIFGTPNFVNEIVWKRKSATSYTGNSLGIANDTIFWFKKSGCHIYNPSYSIDDEVTQAYIKERYRYKTPEGRVYKVDNLGNPEYRPNLIYEYKGCLPPPNGWAVSLERMKKMDEEGRLEFPKKSGGRLMRRQFLDEYKGQILQNLWTDIYQINSQASERENYPTQKPEALLKRIIELASNPGSLIFDAFMGSGTTQSVAMKLGRRFIGADINLGAVQITTKRLIQVAAGLTAKTQAKPPMQQPSLLLPTSTPTLDEDEESKEAAAPAPDPTTFYTGFEVYNVNHYDIFRNPVQAKELLIEALEAQPLGPGNIFDGTKDGRMVKIMPVNRIATRADLNDLVSNFDYTAFQRRHTEKPNQPVERITLVCMGHEPDLAAHLQRDVHPYKLDVEVVDILRDRQDLQFKRDSEAQVVVQGEELVITAFYPMNLLQKLSYMKEDVTEWRELVESVMIDWNYDGAVLTPAIVDIPEKNELVAGRYEIPPDAGDIRVKITDLLSESWEGTVTYG